MATSGSAVRIEHEEQPCVWASTYGFLVWSSGWTGELLIETEKAMKLTEWSHHLLTKLPNRCLSRKISGCEGLPLGKSV